MLLKLLQDIGITNLSKDDVARIREAYGFEKAVELSKLSPTQRHLYSVHEQKQMHKEIAELKSENARLWQQNKGARITGAMSALAITIGGGLISTFSDGTNDLFFGIGWGLTIFGVGMIFIKSLVDY